MEPIKVVVRYSNGKIIKGFTQDFFPNKDRFQLYLATQSLGEATDVLVQKRKALFFVRDFIGNSQHYERKKYLEGEKPSGLRVKVTFVDGVVLVGSTLGYDPKRQGFFPFLADPKTNNIRVFAVSRSSPEISTALSANFC